MEIVLISFVALIASLLTFFSGFGLGTILTPFFVLFFPIDVAIALTGIVHLLNNFFKIGLIGKHIQWNIGLKFGLTALIGSYLGAKSLFILSGKVVYHYSLFGHPLEVTLIKFSVALLMMGFALIEIIPKLRDLHFEKDKIYFGGILSGFFGGLSGNQGALRSMFLIRFGLKKEAYIATGVLIACFIDITRLSVYFKSLALQHIEDNYFLLIFAILSAFIGAFIGSKLLTKATHSFVQLIVTVMIILVSIALGLGIL
jgi:uncharacterized protein